MFKNNYLLFAVLVGAYVSAHAQPFPSKTLRIIVGFPAGGATDISARAVAQQLTTSIGQQVIVDNRPGAASNIGAEIVARAAPDGYTLFKGSVSLAINASLYAKLPYDALRDLAPVVHTANTPFQLTIHPSMPVHNVNEFIAFVKARPKQVNYGTAGAGSGAHLFMEYFNSAVGIQMTSVHYKGAAPATVDLLAGQIPVLFDNVLTLYPLAKSGKLRALAVSTSQRSALAPELPTLAESGVPGYDANAWFGIFVPAATPKDIVARLNAEINKSLQTAEMRERLRLLGATPVGGTPEQFAALFRDEVAKWAKVVKQAGVRVD